jgi:transposase InsO family protein
MLDATLITTFYQLLHNKGFRPETYHTDGERSLGFDFEDHLKEVGMQLHQTASYTPDQNGMAERAGGVIMQVARSIRLAARLLADL